MNPIRIDSGASATRDPASGDTQTLTAGAPPPVPGYELGELIGRGGMGDVYRARDLELDREVAVKILQERYPVDSPTAARFVEEARITGQLQHPGIPAVYRVAKVADGRPFLAMKLIKGQTLDELLKANPSPLPPPRIGAGVGGGVNHLAVIEAVAQALGYAHAHDVIHRDLKPQNVMVGMFGEVQVMDWGLAKVLTASREREQPEQDPEATTAATLIRTARDSDTCAGSVLGTPAYMPPEQAAGESGRVSKSSDVFGLGALWCKLLTGEPPFTGADAESVRRSALRGKTEEALARLDACGAEPEVVALCKRCLSIEPEDRPADANEVAKQVAALRLAAEERAKQAELSRARAEVRAAEQAKRRRAVLWAAGIVVAVLLLGVAGTGIGLYWADAARRHAVAAEKATDEKRQEAEAARADAQAKEAEANAVIKFFEDHVFAAGRPKGQEGGQGSAVSLRDAILAGLPALGNAFGDQPLVEARLRTTLGTTFYYLGEAERALEQYGQARVLFTRHRGPDHLDTLRSMTGLANSYAAMNRHAEALKLREEALAAQKRVLPPGHPDTLHSMNNLAISYYALNRQAEALQLYEETLAARKRVLPPDHPDTLRSMNNLAVSYAALNRHAEALKLFEETLAARKRVLPPDHPDTLANMNNLASSYGELNRHAEALKLREDTLTAMKRVLPPDHPNTLMSMYNLAGSYFALGRHDDALRLGAETLAARKRVLPPHHPDTFDSMWGVAASLVALDRGTEAIPVIDECVAKAAGKAVHPSLIPGVMTLRLQHFRKAGDPAGCRATAVMWEKLNRTDAGSLYDAACFRAVAALVHAKDPAAKDPAADAARLAREDADRAMEWLKKAVAAGYRDRAHMEKDADLDFLRGREDFKMLLDKLQKK